MDLTPMFIAALIVLPAAGLVIWAWLCMAQIEEDLRAFSVFEGLHFESRLPQSTEGVRWPIPG